MAHLRKHTSIPIRYLEEDEQHRNTTISNTEEEYSPYSKSSRRSHSPHHHYRYGMPILISLLVLSSICSFVSVKLQTTPQNLVLLGGVAQEPLHSSTRFGVTPMDIPHAKEIVLMMNNEEKKKEKEGEEGDVRQLVVQEGDEMEKVSSRRGRRRLQEDNEEEEEEGEEEDNEGEEEETDEGEEDEEETEEEEEDEESDEQQQQQFENHLHTHTLTPKSVILITGAAGYLGSELAMALYQTYNIQTILCIDSFDSSYTGGGPFSASSSSGAALTDSQWAAKLSLEQHSGKETTRSLAERDLTLLEYKRQRTFRLLRSIPKVKFYKTDIRPSIPEYFDVGGVPVLDNVFDRYTDISHVVHLADAYQPHNGQEEDDEGQAVPRVREQTKTGMMEVILEQIYKEEKRREILYKEMEERKKVDGDDHLPPKKIQFVFGSSYEVYNGVNSRYGSSIKSGNADDDDEEKKEDRALTTASSLHGASKILDELLASTYGHLYGINSVGLRFFPVYGPWSPPGSALFDMAEMAVSDSNVSLLGSKGGAAADAKDKDDDEEDGDAADKNKANDTSNPPKTQFQPQDGVDFVYIDDAVDAILSAMQYQIPKGVTSPVVFNVGSGQSTTLTDISKLMEEHFPRSSKDAANNPPLPPPPNDKRAPVTFRANIQRANNHLGWSPHTTLQDGIASLLAWHYDRAFPYGPPPPQSQSTTTITLQPPSIISTHGIANCNPFDIECLRGTTVYPCASECANPNMCHPTIYDSSIPKLQQLTQNCDIVLYTVALGQETTKEDIPNGIKYKVKPDGRSYVPSSQDGQECNIAFVSQNSRIVTDADDNNKHGYWYLIPLPSTSSITRGEELLPKLSPSKLFHPTVTKAIFVNPNILIADIPTLLKQWNYHPFSSSSEQSSSQTALMGERKHIPKPKGLSYTFSTVKTTNHMDEYAARQERAYNTMKVGLHGEMKYDKVILPTTNTHNTSTSSTTTTTTTTPHHEDYNIMGSSDWLVHGLNVEDARLFRCDVYGEVLQWNVQVEDTAFDFVLGLHDLWSRIIVQWAGFEPWWKNVKVEKGDSHTHNKKKKKEKIHKKNDHDEKKEDGENDKEEEDEKEYMDVGSWMGMLSSKYTYYFVRILPPSKDLIVRLDSK